MTTHRVTISSVTPTGVHPQFFGTFLSSEAADEYDREFRKLAARAGVLIRVDRDVVVQKTRGLTPSGRGSTIAGVDVIERRER